MKKFIYLFALLGLAITPVQAATFDYAAYADGQMAGATSVTGLGEAGYDTFSATVDGITVDAIGLNSTGVKAHAYLDSGDAGLGVCSTGLVNNSLGNNQCVDRADDNVTANESLSLTFSSNVNLDSITLLNAQHGTTFGANDQFAVSVDGAAAILFSLTTMPDISSVVWGQTFDFINVAGAQFYINTMDVSAVPVPAAGILFASALLGAGAFGRRKKKAKATVVGAFARAS